LLDTYKHKGQRARLVQLLADKGIQDENVLTAIGVVPRQFFVESILAESAYEDRALPIPAHQTISQPFTVAFQTELLALKPRMKVLEIGTGSGYQTAVLCEMGMRVFSVELEDKLHKLAKGRLEDLGYKARLHWGDGSKGWPTHQPYQRILVTAASPWVPAPLKKQLDIGGKLIIPVGTQKQQRMYEVTRLSYKEYEVRKHQHFAFVPLRGRYGFDE